MSAQEDISESELIRQYQESGDQEILGQLFLPYMELLYGVCLKYLKNVNKAQDAVMDVYEHVSKKLKTHDVKAFRPWLYVVTKNHCMEKMRKQQRDMQKKKVAHDVYLETVYHPDDEDKEGRHKRMEICMDQLNEEQKACIEAFYYKSMTYEQIAETSSLKWSTVRSHIQNGRRNLKKCIDNK